MYLWQIRHNPIRQQTLLRLTFFTLIFGAVVVNYCPERHSAAAQSDESSSRAAGSEEKPTPAEEFLGRVRRELPKHRTIKADLLQTVSIGDQHFKIEGQYLSSSSAVVEDQAINKLRLNYRIIPNQGIQGEMLEICDGKELWTELKLPDSKQSSTDSRRVTRRNVQQILAAALAASKAATTESPFSVELGLGGVPALLASLERTMTFDAMKDEQIDGHGRTTIQGHWKKELIADAVARAKNKDDALPPYVPDLVRVVISDETLFPEKVYFLKKQPQKKTYKSLVSLEFNNVEFDGQVDEAAFDYILPEGISPPEDVTKQYLDRWTAPAADPAAKK